MTTSVPAPSPLTNQSTTASTGGGSSTARRSRNHTSRRGWACPALEVRLWRKTRAGQAPRLSRLAKYPRGFAPCCAERLRLSGRNPRTIIIFLRRNAPLSCGEKQVIEKGSCRKGQAFPQSERRSRKSSPSCESQFGQAWGKPSPLRDARNVC